MRSEGNRLDLNNLPEDYTKDGKQTSEDTSSSAGVYRKKKSGAKEGKDELGKVYECRFCSLKFCKSQALGGHMNRHRQERETETLNKARQLVFTNDLAPGHIGYVPSGAQQIPHGGYQPSCNNLGDPPLAFRSLYPTRLFSTVPTHPPLGQSQAVVPPYMYASPQRMIPVSSPYPPAPPAASNDYFLGHVLSNSSFGNTSAEGNYTCIGAPVGPGFVNGGIGGGGGGGVVDLTLHNQDEGINWGRR